LNLVPFGIKHEISKKYSIVDWIINRKIRDKIDSINADILIASYLKSNSSFLVSRLGGTEAKFISQFLKRNPQSNLIKRPPIVLTSRNRWSKINKEVQRNAGFFYTNPHDAAHFVELYLNALRDTDILGAWGTAFSWPEVFALRNSELKVININYTAPWIEPYILDSENNVVYPWSFALKDKKVLVISPFSKSIQLQYDRIHKVFPTTYYPNFDLQVIKAPLTQGQADLENLNWNGLLQDIIEKIRVQNFDVALISCGSYSLPLAHFVKQMGKVGIHCGGGLQLFFGIMGNRWNKSHYINSFHNKYWVRPLPEETPPGSNLVEGACYW
jgi:hypothetical protein